jgi:hypothetical protein
MNMHLVRWMLLAALCTATGLGSRAATAPLSLVGKEYSLFETNGVLTTMRFLAANRYEKKIGTNDLETGFFTATRASTDTWKVATTKSDGSLTIQYTIVFTGPDSGTYTAVGAGFRWTGPISSEPSIPPSKLASIDIQNETGKTGPSLYRIDFIGDEFFIRPPGYGSGKFSYTPGDPAVLVLTFTGELAGDVDTLNLDFRAASGSPLPSRQSGRQLISGQETPVSGTFNYVTQ